jgi:hypothetical protein
LSGARPSCYCRALRHGRLRGLLRAFADAGHIQTTNLLERLFVEERRRLKIIPNALGEKPVLKLMFDAIIRGHRALADGQGDRIRTPPAPCRQTGSRQDYEARTGLKAKPSS